MANRKYADYSLEDMKYANTAPYANLKYGMYFNDETFLHICEFCPEYSDIYYISNYGRIYNSNTGCINLTMYNRNGYETTNLAGCNKDGTLLRVLIHVLVMRCFQPIPNYKELKLQVNHINGNKRDNRFVNLEWVTASENINHAIRTGLMDSCENHQWAKLTNEEVHKICKLLEQGKTATQVCMELYGNLEHKCAVDSIKQKDSWKNISSQYNIPDINKYGSRLTKEQLLLVYNMQNEGRSNREILIALGYDPYAMTEYDRDRLYKIMRRLKKGEGYHFIFDND